LRLKDAERLVAVPGPRSFSIDGGLRVSMAVGRLTAVNRKIHDLQGLSKTDEMPVDSFAEINL
jgi:hypothetical protein